MPTLGHGAGHGVIELGAALVLVIGGALLIAIQLRTRAALDGPPVTTIGRTGGVPSPSVRRSLAIALAGLSAGAAAIHLAAAPAHLAEFGALGAGFLAAAAFQAAWAVASLGGPSARTLAIGVVGNLALIGAWAWTRAVGLPLAGTVGGPEAIGPADAAAVTFEILLVAGATVRLLDLDGSAGRRAGVSTVASIALVPVLGLVLLVASLAAASLLAEPEPGRHAASGESVARP